MKRTMDVLFSSIGLLLLFPLFLVIALSIWFNMGTPIFFRQMRPGKDGKPFQLLKFRTMKQDADESGNSLPDEFRTTEFGKALRSTSLDELPELWNVLKGEMSLVGPRPLLVEYLPLYSETQARRHELKPGITGWAQVNGRNAISWEEKFKLDTWYVDNQSLWLDLKILLLTIKKVFTREGISAQGEVTMSKFKGSKL